jgi:DNA adenine methylase
MTYPGGKGGDGVFQTLINLIPPHDVYIEAFLGGGAIMRHKRPAARSIGVDRNPAVIEEWKRTAARLKRPDIALHSCDGEGFLRRYAFTGREFVYCDPPYLPETRAKFPVYEYEMAEEEHRGLLGLLSALPCPVMLSGYWSPLYAEALADWHAVRFAAATRGGRLGDEWVWMNYPPPTELHDYRFLGRNYRDRERIKRQQARWTAKFKNLPLLERRALLGVLQESVTG